MLNSKKEEKEGSPRSSIGKMVAKKDFVIHCNDDHIEIKKGEEVICPEKYLPNLKTEGVI